MRSLITLVCVGLLVITGDASSVGSLSRRTESAQGQGQGQAESSLASGGSVVFGQTTSSSFTNSPITISGANFQVGDSPSQTQITASDGKSPIIFGSEGSRVSAVRHSVTSPRDSATGLATGRRMHKPFTITKEIDRATPQLYQTFSNGGTLPTVTISKSAAIDARQKFTGTRSPIFNTVLTNAQISDIDTDGDSETITFTYQKISWTWVDGGITHEDSWSTQK